MKSFLLTLLVFITLVAEAQVFNSNAILIKFRGRESGQWTQWSGWEATDLPIVIDLDNRNIRIMSEKGQTLIMTYVYTPETDPDGNDIMTFDCKDNKDTSCQVQIVSRKKYGHRIEMHIIYENFEVCYKIILE